MTKQEVKEEGKQHQLPPEVRARSAAGRSSRPARG